MRLDLSIYSPSSDVRKLVVESNASQQELEASELGDVFEFRVVEIHRTVVET